MSSAAANSSIDLEQVWSGYSSSLERFLRSKVSNQEDVEDLLQDILVKVVQNIGTLTDHDKLKSWLFQIASNSITDLYRKRGRRTNPHPDDLWYGELSSGDKHLLEDCVAPFVEALPDKMGDLIRHIDLQGGSQKDHASDLGIRYSTLKTRVQASRRELRKMMEDCCDFVEDSQGNIIDYKRKNRNCFPDL